MPLAFAIAALPVCSAIAPLGPATGYERYDDKRAI
jgi:hypothetical protein